MCVGLAGFGVSDNSIGQENQLAFNGRFEFLDLLHELNDFLSIAAFLLLPAW